MTNPRDEIGEDRMQAGSDLSIVNALRDELENEFQLQGKIGGDGLNR